MFRFRFPKDDKYIAWTNHIKNKMLFYGLSEAKLRNVLKSPKRIEEGIAPGTISAMQLSRGKKKPEEVWIMYKTRAREKVASGSKILMISAWRYPGITKPGQRPEIPPEILEELDAEGFL